MADRAAAMRLISLCASPKVRPAKPSPSRSAMKVRSGAVATQWSRAALVVENRSDQGVVLVSTSAPSGRCVVSIRRSA